MTWLFLEPTDVWTFRDARSTHVGGGHLAASLFPPTPQTVQGALRSLLLGRSGVAWRAFREQSTPAAQALGTQIGYPAHADVPASLGQFTMAGPFVAYAEPSGSTITRYMPLPLDVRRTKSTPPQYFTLQPTQRRPFAANWPQPDLSPLWPTVEQDFEEPEPLWLTASGLQKYLAGQLANWTPATDLLTADALFGSEPRLGIALDYTYRRPIEQMLYQVGFVRPETGVGLLVEVGATLEFPEAGVLRLGGENRAAYYRRVPDVQVQLGVSAPAPTCYFKVILLTPAYFDDGWRPRDGNAGWSRLLGTPVQLVAAALGRPHYIGGWDLAQRGGYGWHKPLYAYVPPGSVYFFRSETTVSLPQRPLTQTPVGETLPFPQLGFGQIVAAPWSWGGPGSSDHATNERL